MTLIGSASMDAVHQAIRGLNERQRTIANNVANVETPGFLAGKVDFESHLKRAVVNKDNPLSAPIGHARSLEPTRPNGSNVNIDEETLAGIQTQLSMQLATQMMTGKFQRLKMAISGQA